MRGFPSREVSKQATVRRTFEIRVFQGPPAKEAFDGKRPAKDVFEVLSQKT